MDGPNQRPFPPRHHSNSRMFQRRLQHLLGRFCQVQRRGIRRLPLQLHFGQRQVAAGGNRAICHGHANTSALVERRRLAINCVFVAVLHRAIILAQ